jgi:peptide/nickel transport system permease protein
MSESGDMGGGGFMTATAPMVHRAPVDPETGFSEKAPWGIAAWLATGWLTIVAICVVFAPVLPLTDPLDNFTGIRNVGPFQLVDHPLGGDGSGRDLFSRIVFGARNSMGIGILAVTFGFLIGGSLGMLAGFYKNWFSTALATLFDILLAFPGLVLALSLVSFLTGPPNSDPIMPAFGIVTLALGIVSIPVLARITRASALAWSQREFVMAARAQGAKDSRIIFREVLPNVLPAMFSITLLGVAVVIIAEGGLAILGVGIPPPEPSWGNIIATGRSGLREAPFIVFIPSTVIFLTVLSLNFLGDKIRDRFDVRESAL